MDNITPVIFDLKLNEFLHIIFSQLYFSPCSFSLSITLGIRTFQKYSRNPIMVK